MLNVSLILALIDLKRRKVILVPIFHRKTYDTAEGAVGRHELVPSTFYKFDTEI